MPHRQKSKNFFSCISIISLAFTFIGTARAEPLTYTTSTGAVFTQVSQPDFSLDGSDLAWKDPSGRVWSDILWPKNSVTKRFTNEALAPEQGDTITKSPATLGCSAIGGQLPSAEDYEELISNFELDSHGKITEAGRKDLDSLFTDMARRPFWTASTVPNRPDIAWVFNGDDGRIVYWGQRANRNQLAYVRCVAR